MSRLTRKIMDKIELPIIPMEINSKEDLDIFHKVRREYEAMVIKLVAYEDREEKQRFQLGDTAYMIDDDYRFFESEVYKIELDNGIYYYYTADCDFENENIGDWVFKSAADRALHLEIICGL